MLVVALAPAITLAAAAAAPADVPASAAAAIELLRPGWQVLHCGVSRGVLYVTYADRGEAAIAPAVPNDAIARACAAAGHPLATGAAPRSAAPPPPAAASAAAARAAAAEPRNRSQPSFTPRALGSSLGIDARNDGDIAWHCTINFSWTSDDNAGVPRSETTQATLPPRQNNRVAGIGGAYRNPRFVGTPSWFCNPAER